MGLLTDEIRKSQILGRIFFGCTVSLVATVAGCGGVVGPLTSVTPPPTVQSLTASDVAALVQAAAQAADPNTMVIAVVDRAGNVLGVYRKPSAPTLATGNFSAQLDVNELAVSLARTGAFFSNDQAPLSSRTVRFISGIHFPPGIANTPNAALYGIENTNRGCDLDITFLPGKAVPPAGSLAGGLCKGAAHAAGCGTGPVTGKVDLFDSDPAAVDPGGVPLFRGTAVVGGIGVAGVPPPAAEFAAVAAAATGFLPTVAPPGVVFIDGIRLPFVEQTTRP